MCEEKYGSCEREIFIAYLAADFFTSVVDCYECKVSSSFFLLLLIFIVHLYLTKRFFILNIIHNMFFENSFLSK